MPEYRESKQIFKVNTEYCTFHMLLLQGHMREMLSPFASPSQELGFLPDILQKENVFCEAVQRSYVCTACERHKSSVLLSPLLDLSLVQKFIVLQGCCQCEMRTTKSCLSLYCFLWVKVVQVAFSHSQLRKEPVLPPAHHTARPPHPSAEQTRGKLKGLKTKRWSYLRCKKVNFC